MERRSFLKFLSSVPAVGAAFAAKADKPPVARNSFDGLEEAKPISPTPQVKRKYKRRDKREASLGGDFLIQIAGLYFLVPKRRLHPGLSHMSSGTMDTENFKIIKDRVGGRAGSHLGLAPAQELIKSAAWWPELHPSGEATFILAGHSRASQALALRIGHYSNPFLDVHKHFAANKEQSYFDDWYSSIES